MPLIFVDVVKGRSESEIATLLDAIHQAVVDGFGVVATDRYQVLRSHPSHEVVLLDTGLGLTRSEQRVVIHVVSKRRTRELKERFFATLVANLRHACGIDPADVVVAITENADEDWSFGNGRAQFLTGELT